MKIEHYFIRRNDGQKDPDRTIAVTGLPSLEKMLVYAEGYPHYEVKVTTDGGEIAVFRGSCVLVPQSGERN